MAKWCFTHWMTGTRFYKIFSWVKRRCNTPSMTWYENYWGRGIKCEWKKFEDFRDDMYESYKAHVKQFGEKDTTLERIDVNGNYCKKNCRWATIKEQINNTRVNVKVKFNWKEYQSLQYLCEYLGIKYMTVYKRVFLEWQDIEKAIYEMKNKKISYKWVTYKWITDLCRKLWLNRTSINYRLKIWMSLEEAIETDFRQYNKKW